MLYYRIGFGEEGAGRVGTAEEIPPEGSTPITKEQYDDVVFEMGEGVIHTPILGPGDGTGRRSGITEIVPGEWDWMGDGDGDDKYGVFTKFLGSMGEVLGDLIGPGGIAYGLDFLQNKEYNDNIDLFNLAGERLAEAGRVKKEEWTEKARGVLEKGADGVGKRPGQYLSKTPVVMPLGDGQYGLDLNADGTRDLDDSVLSGSRQSGITDPDNPKSLTFVSEEAARDYIEKIGGTVDFFSQVEGQSPYTQDVDDSYLFNLKQLKLTLSKIPSPEDRKKFVDQVKLFTDGMADQSADFIKSAMSDETYINEKGYKTDSVAKSRTALINSLNTILGSTADAITLADQIGSGAVTDADIARSIDVGDSLEKTAGDVSDQDYWRAMAVVAANEEKYDLLKAASKEAQLDIYNKLEAQRHQGGFTGLSTRHTRDLAREFLANNTALAKSLSDINIENAKVLGDAHVRSAQLKGEAATKAKELFGAAEVSGAERDRAVAVSGAERAGRADIAGEENLIANKDYLTNLRNKMKFEGFKQETYQLLRPKLQDDALTSGVIAASDMLAPMRLGEANYGTPDIAKQMIGKPWDTLKEFLDVLTGKKKTTAGGDDATEVFKKLIAGLKKKPVDFKKEKEAEKKEKEAEKKVVVTPPAEGPGDEKKTEGPGETVGTEPGTEGPSGLPDGHKVITEVEIDPDTGEVIKVDIDGNGVEDRADLNEDGVITIEDEMFYDPENGEYYRLDEGGNRILVGDGDVFKRLDGTKIDPFVDPSLAAGVTLGETAGSTVDSLNRFRHMGPDENGNPGVYFMDVYGRKYTEAEFHALPDDQKNSMVPAGTAAKEVTGGSAASGTVVQPGLEGGSAYIHPVTGEQYGDDGYTKVRARYNPETGKYDGYVSSRPVTQDPANGIPEGYTEADYIGDDPETGWPLYSKELVTIPGMSLVDVEAEGMELTGDPAPADTTDTGLNLQIDDLGLGELDLDGLKTEAAAGEKLLADSGNLVKDGGNATTLGETFNASGGNAGVAAGVGNLNEGGGGEQLVDEWTLGDSNTNLFTGSATEGGATVASGGGGGLDALNLDFDDEDLNLTEG